MDPRRAYRQHLARRLLPGVRTRALPSAHPARSYRQPGWLLGRQNDAAHRDGNRRRHRGTGGYGIRSGQGNSISKSGARSAATEIKRPVHYVRCFERRGYVALRLQIADDAEHRRFRTQGHYLRKFLFCVDFHHTVCGDDVDGHVSSESKVYHLEGYLRTKNSGVNVPESMQAAGYATSAFFSNPYAFYPGQHFKGSFNFLPEPTFQNGGLQYLWEAFAPLHQNSGIGSRIDEYMDLAGLWNPLWHLPGNLPEQFRAVESFEHAHEMLANLPDGFFLWIHVMTPHGPYLPGPEERGRFLAASEQQIYEGEGKPNWKPHYAPDQQAQVDHWRLRYDEFLLGADRAFGVFMSDAESSGKLETQPSFFRPIMEKALRAASSSMAAPTSPAQSSTYRSLSVRRASRMTARLLLPQTRQRWHPQSWSLPDSRDRTGCAASRW